MGKCVQHREPRNLVLMMPKPAAGHSGKNNSFNSFNEPKFSSGSNFGGLIKARIIPDVFFPGHRRFAYP